MATYADGIVTGAEAEHLRDGVGRRIRSARTAAALSQARLAALCGVHRTTIQRLEHGQHRPRADLLRMIALAVDRQDPDRLETKLVAAAADSIRSALGGAGGKRRRLIEFAERRGETLLENHERYQQYLALRAARTAAWLEWHRAMASGSLHAMGKMLGVDYPDNGDRVPASKIPPLDIKALGGSDPPQWSH